MKSEKEAKQKFVQTCPPTSQNENGLHYCRNTLENSYQVKYVRRANRTSLDNNVFEVILLDLKPSCVSKSPELWLPRNSSFSRSGVEPRNLFLTDSQMFLLQVVEDNTLRTKLLQVCTLADTFLDSRVDKSLCTGYEAVVCCAMHGMREVCLMTHHWKIHV